MMNGCEPSHVLESRIGVPIHASVLVILNSNNAQELQGMFVALLVSNRLCLCCSIENIYDTREQLSYLW